ncbi:MAG: hypothetical protein H8D24_00160 [Gammaproteobacteria bacterium]|uniref:Uncharacterized protein n=1 Tax=Candidatus Thiopontia autotrophica TaxID=2841688 RepID=A0A8J6TV96_9GAMM|nr:hypothetical protein [Candidatus Thiopontia autotrophica]MBL6969637.1 hypothetical protein [Gammaproteobacteria bacterium]
MRYFARFTTLSLIAIAAVAILLLPDEDNSTSGTAPWEIIITPSGNSRLLGITIGESLLKEAQTVWQEEPEITLFLPENGEPKVEAYFQRIASGGVRASIVTEIKVDKPDLDYLINQGARISTQGDGSHKITLDGDGISLVENSIVSSITYMPKTDLTPQIIQQRFGEAGMKFSIEDGLEHWIYPQYGLDIILSTEGREVLQYVSPKDIDRLTTPLIEAQGN